jgi:beta-lactamase regulating signal transducer with metallopeptidase domain
VSIGGASLAAWTLCHFVWQGAAVWALARLWARAARGWSPAARYRGAAAWFLVISLLPIATAVLGALFPPAEPSLDVAVPLLAASRAAGGADRLVAGMLLVWGAGTLAALGWLALDARFLARLGRRARPADAGMRRLVLRLAGECGLATAPEVLEGPVDGPMVTGFRRPCLLLPPGASRLLEPAEFHAVLLHELAHLRRRDLLAGAAQRVAQAFLWLHPAVWLLSREVDRERERCCDAEAVRAGAARLDLARALVALEGARPRGGALAAHASSGELKARVEELLAPRTEPPGPGTRGAAAALLLAAAVPWAGVLALPPGSLFPVVEVRAEDPAGAFTLWFVGSRIAAATVNGGDVKRELIEQRDDLAVVRGGDGSVLLEVKIHTPGHIRWTPRPPP